MEPVEQDKQGGDELPSYEDLASQSGPNSRFGRWQGWIEKRAAERRDMLTEEERERQRQRGWGNDIDESYESPGPAPAPEHLRLQINVEGAPGGDVPSSSAPEFSPLLGDLSGTTLPPTHLRLINFGSRFLPHSTAEIRCLFPLPGDRFLLIGHDEGLSVIDMFPQERNNAGVVKQKAPNEAKVFPIWQGDIVYQMSLIEQNAEGQGVVMALVGAQPNGQSNIEPWRGLRMYNLSSLRSLAEWAVIGEDAPLCLQELYNGSAQQSPAKKHLSPSSMTIKGLLSISESPTSQCEGPSISPPTPQPQLGRRSPVSKDSSWDTISDVPLRWAQDYVILNPSGTRHAGASVLFYTLWNDEIGYARGSTLLAAVVKGSILLYESPKRERYFRFVKDFYVPSLPTSVTFISQSLGNLLSKPLEGKPSVLHRRSESLNSQKRKSITQPIETTVAFNPKLSLFIVFGKKAGWIRLADSVVGEIEFFDDSVSRISLPFEDIKLLRRPRSFAFEKDTKGYWAAPQSVEIPSSHNGPSRAFYILTRAKESHIVPSPLPAVTPAIPPLCIIHWEFIPSSVVPRFCKFEGRPTLQLVAVGENGLEVREMPVSSISKGKGNASGKDICHAEADVGGSCGLLCGGGHWHRLNASNLLRSDSITSQFSLDTQDDAARWHREEGVYGWCQKGLQDWRVFWVGGEVD